MIRWHQEVIDPIVVDVTRSGNPGNGAVEPQALDPQAHILTSYVVCVVPRAVGKGATVNLNVSRYSLVRTFMNQGPSALTEKSTPYPHSPQFVATASQGI